MLLASLLAVGVAGVLGKQRAQPPEVSVDWPTFLGRADPVWSAAPLQWYESGFVGNGACTAVNHDPLHYL